jgi:hypothetical protein
MMLPPGYTSRRDFVLLLLVNALAVSGREEKFPAVLAARCVARGWSGGC